MNLDAYRKSLKQKKEAAFLTRADRVVDKPSGIPPPIDYRKVCKDSQLVCNNSVQGGDCYGESYCPVDCKCKDRWCETCQIRICGCCYELRYLHCPGCKTAVNKSLKSGRNNHSGL